jgi:hypothetical protein
MQVASKPVLRLRVGQLQKHARRLGLDPNNQAIATHLGVSRTTVKRMLSGELAPGERFIARTLAAFPDLKFDDLFEVVEDAGDGA